MRFRCSLCGTSCEAAAQVWRCHCAAPLVLEYPVKVDVVAARRGPRGIWRWGGARCVMRPIYFKEAGAFVDCPVYDRGLLRPGNVISGPAIIEQMDATIVVLPGQRATVDPRRSLALTGDP